MSDWKSRAVKVDAGSDWKSRAKPTESIPEAPPVAQPVEDSGPGMFSPTSKSGAALSGFSQGASMGFADELGGVVGGGIGAITNGARSMLKTGPGHALVRSLVGGNASALPDAAIDALVDEASDTSLEQVTGAKPGQSAYDAVRNSMRSDDKRGSDAHPVIHGGAALAGALTTPIPLKGGVGVKIGGATLKPWAGRALVGAGLGAATGAGTSEADTVGGVVGDAGGGALIGGIAAPLVGKATDKLGGQFAKWLEERSRINALKAVGLEGGISNKAKRLGYENLTDLMSLGAKVRDEGDIIKPFRTPADAAKRLEGALQESANAKGAAVEELDKMAADLGEGFNFNKLAQRADDAVRPELGWDPLSRENAKAALEMAGKASASRGGFGMAEQVRRSMGKSIPWNAPAFGKALPEEVANMRQVYGMTADEIAQQARDVEARYLLKQGKIPTAEDLGASNQVSAMNKRISTLIDAQALANEQATRDAARGSFGLKDIIAGAALGGGHAATGGNPLMSIAAGAGVAAASKFARDRLPSAMTYAQHATSRALPTLTSGAEVPTIKALTAETSPVAVSNAYDALMERFGIKAKSKEELADEAFLKGQSDPSMQAGR